MKLLNRKTVAFMFVLLVSLTGCLFGPLKRAVPTPEFIPFPTNALSCSIRPLVPWGMIEVSIMNTSSVMQVFSAPRRFTGIDLQSATNIQVNTIKMDFRWGGDRGAFAEYLTFERRNIVTTNMSLLPNSTSKVVINLKDFYISARCNLVPFNEWFKQGESNICIQASLKTINRTEETVVSMSNTETIKGDYIYETEKP